MKVFYIDYFTYLFLQKEMFASKVDGGGGLIGGGSGVSTNPGKIMMSSGASGSGGGGLGMTTKILNRIFP